MGYKVKESKENTGERIQLWIQTNFTKGLLVLFAFLLNFNSKNKQTLNAVILMVKLKKKLEKITSYNKISLILL